MRKNLLLLLLYAASILTIKAQQKYFVDGFHGGIYGHYPIKTYTQFLVDRMNENPSWYIGLEIEPETWDTVMVRTPQAYLAFKAKMETEQAEYTNPSYAQPYLYCINGESIIRQFQYGIRKLRQHFPHVIISTYAVEEPCFTSCIPTILPQLGFRYSVLKCPNTCWGGYSAAYGGELVNFIGPDGTSMLTVPRYESEDLEENSVWQTIAWGNQKKYFDACFRQGILHPVGMTYQDAGWTNGPWIGTDPAKMDATVYTRWTKYIEQQSVGTTNDNYYFSQEDVRPGLMWGSQVMQKLAQQCRREEYMLPKSEKMAVMAHIENGFKPSQKDLDEAWRQLLLAQHHDCWIVPYNRLNAKGTWADNVKIWTEASDSLARDVTAKAIQSYGDKGAQSIRVFNTLGYARQEVINVDINDASSTAIDVDVPAFGYVTVPVKEIKSPRRTKTVTVKDNTCTIENNMYRLVLDLQHGGVIKSMKSKKDGFEYADSSSRYSLGELSGFFADAGRFVSSTENAASVTIREDNRLVKSIDVEGIIAGTKFVNTITLHNDSPVIDCSLVVKWERNQRIGDFTRPRHKAKDDRRTTFYDTRYQLSLMLPTSLKEPKLSKNAPFDVCQSQLKSTFYNSWDSIKHNVINEWIDVHSEQDNHSLALLSDHTTSYSFADDYPLALTVQYSGPGLWGRDYTINGTSIIRYALVPHTGTWDTAGISQINTCWNEPLVIAKSNISKGLSKSLIDVGNSGYELTSATCDDESVTVRLFNASGNSDSHDIELGFNVEEAAQVDLLGNTIATLPISTYNGKTVLSLSMPRFGVKTYRLVLKK